MVGTGARAQGGEQLELENQIQARFLSDSDLKNNTVDVRVIDGVAILNGTVASEAERAKAARLARVKGVTEVDDRLKLGATKASAHDDAVTAKLDGLYMTSPILKQANISVTTSGGAVTLAGTVPSEEARRQAVDIARNAHGVRQVQDNLLVSGPSRPMAPPPEPRP